MKGREIVTPDRRVLSAQGWVIPGGSAWPNCVLAAPAENRPALLGFQRLPNRSDHMAPLGRTEVAPIGRSLTSNGMRLLTDAVPAHPVRNLHFSRDVLSGRDEAPALVRAGRRPLRWNSLQNTLLQFLASLLALRVSEAL